MATRLTHSRRLLPLPAPKQISLILYPVSLLAAGMSACAVSESFASDRSPASRFLIRKTFRDACDSRLPVLDTWTGTRFRVDATSWKCMETLLLLGASATASWFSEARIGCQEGEPATSNIDLRQQPEAKSNIHTAKWRIFTDKARNLCAQGLYDDAEKYFYRALEEAKKGFGEQDPHVASCYNNLAELFRMKKQYDKAEPLYIEAITRLRESSGLEDGSVGFALHNLAGFYLVQRKLDRARECYEEALKVKGKALGFDHPEYATTMFHLGEVLRLCGNVDDGVALIRDSIKILEQIGLGNTTVAIKRLSRLSEILFISGQMREAEANQRKVMQILELSKDTTTHEIVSAMELLITVLLRQGKLDECKELLEKCISILKGNYGDDEIHIAALLSKLGGIILQKGSKSVPHNKSMALEDYQEAEKLLVEAVRIAERKWKEACLVKMMDSSGKNKMVDARTLLILIQSLATLGEIGIHKLDVVLDSRMAVMTHKTVEEALQNAITLLEDEHVRVLLKPSDVKRLHAECLDKMANLHKKV